MDDDEHRVGLVEALGFDETLFLRKGEYHRQHFSTSIVDVGRGQLLDVVPGRKGDEPTSWLTKRTCYWRFHVRCATLDLSGPYRSVFSKALPWATQIADPSYVVKLANPKLDECRRRIQNEFFGHRGHKHDPSVGRGDSPMAAERLDEHGRAKLQGLLRAGDPRGEASACYNAKEAVRELYTVRDYELAGQWFDELIRDQMIRRGRRSALTGTHIEALARARHRVAPCAFRERSGRSATERAWSGCDTQRNLPNRSRISLVESAGANR